MSGALEHSDQVLVVIDVQGKLASLVHDHENVLHNIVRFIEIIQTLGIPILWTEQAPEKIGATVGPVSELLSPLVKPITKYAFSAFACPAFKQQLKDLGCRKAMIVGIETHVCVVQSAIDLLRHGYEVSIIEDAVSSRGLDNKITAIAHMRSEGIMITTAEMAACALLADTQHTKFKSVMTLIKR